MKVIKDMLLKLNSNSRLYECGVIRNTPGVNPTSYTLELASN